MRSLSAKVRPHPGARVHPEGVTTSPRRSVSIGGSERDDRCRTRAARGADRRAGSRDHAEQALRGPARDRRDRRCHRFASGMVLPGGDLSDPARALDASAARSRLRQRPASVVGATRAGAGRPARGAGDHAVAGRRRTPAGQGPRHRRQAHAPDRPAGSGPGGAGRDQFRARHRSRGSVDRDRRGRGPALDQSGAKRDATAGARPRCRRRQLRGAVVHLRFAADRGRDPDRGDRDRRAAAASAPATRAARRRNRHAGLDRDGVVHRVEQQRVRARSSGPFPTSLTRPSVSSGGRSRSRSRSPS